MGGNSSEGDVEREALTTSTSTVQCQAGGPTPTPGVQTRSRPAPESPMKRFATAALVAASTTLAIVLILTTVILVRHQSDWKPANPADEGHLGQERLRLQSDPEVHQARPVGQQPNLLGTFPNKHLNNYMFRKGLFPVLIETEDEDDDDVGKALQTSSPSPKPIPEADTLNDLRPTPPTGHLPGRESQEFQKSRLDRISEDFLKRFPRDGRSSNPTILTHPYTPRRRQGTTIEKTLAGKSYQDPEEGLTDLDRVTELIYAMDGNEDSMVGPWELHDWMLWVEQHYHQLVVEQQWQVLMVPPSWPEGPPDGGHHHRPRAIISWADYVSKVHPYGVTRQSEKRRLKRERRRWTHADADADGALDLGEFKAFVFPHLPRIQSGGRDDSAPASAAAARDRRVFRMAEIHEDLDTDYDGRVSQEEFRQHHHQGQQPPVADDDREGTSAAAISSAEWMGRHRTGSPDGTVYFRRVLDKDQDSYLTMNELAEWVEPEGFVQAKSEVVHLMIKLDSDNDKLLSLDEVMRDPATFLNSQATYFGNLYREPHFRAKALLLPS